MNIETELMVITMEECAEVIQACSKVLRFGTENNVDELEKEIGDLMCMLELLEEHGYMDIGNVALHAKYKRDKLKIYSNLIVDDKHETEE